jgi:nicotinamidase/pyrazinamidase
MFSGMALPLGTLAIWLYYITESNRAGSNFRSGFLEINNMDRILLSTSALLVVDAQRGFTGLCPDELPVPGGAELVPALNRLLESAWQRIDATQDWHPPDHCSFLGQRDNLYPPHCVMGTPGADFLPGLRTEWFHTIWRKGYHKDFEAYAVTAQHPQFSTFLHAEGIKTVVVCGIATNICCFYSARDLRQAGFRVLLVEDASSGIDVLAAGLFQHQAREEGQGLGIEYVTLEEVCQAVR